jgi:hypothetical protein
MKRRRPDSCPNTAEAAAVSLGFLWTEQLVRQPPSKS